MKANELRLNNYVLDQGMETTVTCIEEERLSTEKGKLPYSFYHEITPIPLTEEWLLKFGFESLFSGAGYVKDRVEIGYNHNGFYIIASGLKIEYAHQLQNLYFALCGNELDIKP